MKNFFKKQKTFLIIAVIAVLLTGGFVYMQFSQGTVTPAKTLVQGFPIMPVYPNAKLIDSTSDPEEGSMYIGVKYSATWEVKGNVPTISKWYADKLKAAGWRVDSLPANTDAMDVQLATFDNPSYALSMSFIKGDDGLTKITAEFSTNYKDFCNSVYGKPCTENQ